MIESCAAILLMAASVAVFAGSICRLRLLRIGEHQWLWIGVYLCSACFSGAEMLDAGRAIVQGRDLDFAPLIAVAGFGLWLLGSHGTWSTGPPEHVKARRPQSTIW